MYVYDGPSPDPTRQISSGNPAGFVPGGLAGAYWGNSLPGPFTANNPSGCLTFVFKSDSSGEQASWLANVTCAPAIQGFQLNAFNDLNSNSTLDPGENNFPSGDFIITNNSSGTVLHLSTNTGIYIFPENNPSNNYDISFEIDPDYATYYNVAVPSYSALNIGSSTGLVPVNFPLTNAATYNDLITYTSCYTQPRAGFNFSMRIYYLNSGNQTISNATLTFINDAATSVFNTSIPVTATSNGFILNAIDLLPGETRYIDVTIAIPSIPNVTLGQLLAYSATLSSAATEINLDNNTSVFQGFIAGSYDPNDISEGHGPEIDINTFAPSDYLTYNIRFENTDTAPAQDVKITNVLDAKIDENSIKMIGASANYVLQRVNNNLTILFNNIQLPVSDSNSNVGHGFVSYKAKLKPGFTVGTTVPNAAKIYFDSNPAIDTNTVVTTFVNTLANATFDSTNNFKIYPNPARNAISIFNEKNSTIAAVEILNMLGQAVLVSDNAKNAIDVSGLETGNYFVKITTDKETITRKFMKE